MNDKEAVASPGEEYSGSGARTDDICTDDPELRATIAGSLKERSFPPSPCLLATLTVTAGTACLQLNSVLHKHWLSLSFLISLPLLLVPVWRETEESPTTYHCPLF